LSRRSSSRIIRREPCRTPARAPRLERLHLRVGASRGADARRADSRRETGAAPLLDSPPYPCDTDTTIENWLKNLVGSYARKLTWTGGQCELVNTPSPLDVKSWPYCAQATVTFVHPKARDDQVLIEIYLEEPAGGHPGRVYAFRSVMLTEEDGPDLERRRTDFQAEWDDRFPPPADAHRCSNE
jgi:hypothetical protein